MPHAKRHFETPTVTYDLDIVLSINNDAAALLVAEFYPALDQSMGCDNSKEPTNINFVVPSEHEQLLLELRAVF